MSDCSTMAFMAEEPMRGAVMWDDGTETELAYNRVANGRRRSARSVTLDGTSFYPDDMELVEEYDGGRCVAVSLDGVRYVRETTGSGLMGDWTCKPVEERGIYAVYVKGDIDALKERCRRLQDERRALVRENAGLSARLDAFRRRGERTGG